MKIKVNKLKPNPFRDLKKYKIDSYKVDALVTSIKETSFWDNILARPIDNGEYQIAYGHHRLFAIEKAKLEEVNIPIRKLDDATMIKIMANENLDEWKLNPLVIKESVRVAKEFLDAELAKVENWKKAKENKLLYPLVLKDITGEANFQSLKSRGVGRETILKFLGGNWKGHMISEALTQLRESKSMQEAVEVFDTQTDAKEFRKVIKKDFKDKITKGQEKKVAKKVAKKVKEKKEKIKIEVQERKKKAKSTGSIRGNEDRRTDLKTMTRMVVEDISEKEAKLKDIELEIKRFDERVRSAYIGTRDLNLLLQELDVEKLEGLKSIFVLDNVSDLLQELRKVLVFFGFDYKRLQIGE